MSGKVSSKMIQRFPGEYDTSIPDNITLAEYVLEQIRQFGDRPAIVHSETKEKVTYAEIINESKDLAAGLQAKFSLKPKETVAIALPSSLQYANAVLGVNLCGATAVLMNPSQTATELEHSIKLTKPRLWIATDEFTGKLHQLYPNASDRPPLIALGGSSWLDVLKAGKGKALKKPVINAKEDAALILFSSGTTGVPKGVSLTNANYTAARRQNIELVKDIPPNDDDVGVVMLPLYHTFGISSILDMLVRGLFFVLIPQFTFLRMLESIQEFRISILSIVPAIATQLVKQPVEKYYDLTCLRVFMSGAAALSKEIAQQLQDKFGIFVFQGYGMTESTLRTHSNFVGFSKEGSIGVVMPFCESIVVDVGTGEALGPNKEGEICVRGPLVMKGYIGNEEATRSTVDKEGWLHTGDVGYYDEDGFFFITDRMKELIKYKGLQVSPTELEQILLTHPDVLDAAVTSIPDEDAGELPRAFVVLKPKAKVKEDELTKFVADQVSPHKRLRGGLYFIDEIPKTATGKIVRRDLKNILAKNKSKL